MKQASYGFAMQTAVPDAVSRHAEEIAIKGYTIILDVLAPDALAELRNKVDAVYEIQERGFGKDALAAIQELDACRSPLLYDIDFVHIAQHPTVLSIVQKFLGDWFILNLQNAVINRPRVHHHQGTWHRDLPYQNFVISRPFAINALWALDAFSPDTGATNFLPYTHKMEALPSDSYIENNRVVATAPAGSVIMFDAMLIHRAGANGSQGTRRAINHMYTVPIIKQQYDFPRAMAHLQDGMDPALQRLLGFTAQVPLNDVAWRQARAARQLESN